MIRKTQYFSSFRVAKIESFFQLLHVGPPFGGTHLLGFHSMEIKLERQKQDHAA